MKEVPVPYIKTNQIGIVLFSILAILLDQPLIVVFLLIVQFLSLLFGIRWNLFVLPVKPLLKSRLTSFQTQSSELTKFNNTIAVVFLLLATIFFAIGLNLAGYIVLGILSGVVSVAIAGYCLGCFLYYQYKKITK